MRQTGRPGRIAVSRDKKDFTGGDRGWHLTRLPTSTHLPSYLDLYLATLATYLAIYLALTVAGSRKEPYLAAAARGRR